jgi:hypothetical protein
MLREFIYGSHCCDPNTRVYDVCYDTIPSVRHVLSSTLRPLMMSFPRCTCHIRLLLPSKIFQLERSSHSTTIQHLREFSPRRRGKESGKHPKEPGHVCVGLQIVGGGCCNSTHDFYYLRLGKYSSMNTSLRIYPSTVILSRLL